MNKKILFAPLCALLVGLSGCSISQLSENYKANLDGRNVAKIECMRLDKNIVEMTDSGGNAVRIEHAAGHCHGEPLPENETKHAIAAAQNVAVSAIGLAGGIYTDESNKSISRDANRTNLAITQDNNATQIEAIRLQEETQQQSLNQLGETIDRLLLDSIAPDPVTETPAEPAAAVQ